MSHKSKRRFALRTVQDGTVTIDGNAYAPSERHMAYDGRLDGQRFAFGRYSHRCARRDEKGADQPVKARPLVRRYERTDRAR